MKFLAIISALMAVSTLADTLAERFVAMVQQQHELHQAGLLKHRLVQFPGLLLLLQSATH